MYVCLLPDSNTSDINEPEFWQLDDEALSDSSDDAPSDMEISTNNPEYNRSLLLSKWIVYFFMLMHTRFKLSDAVLSFFLKFLTALFSILGLHSDICAGIKKLLPSSLHGVRALYKTPKFTRYVVCRKCHCLYYYEECQEGPQNQKRSKLCCFKPYPNHTQQQMRKSCGSV